MSSDADATLAARFARQDDAALAPAADFGAVRERAARIERHGRRRVRLLVAAAVAALVVVPAIAVSHPLEWHFFGTPADPAVRDYIGRVLGSDRQFTAPPRYVAGVRTSRGLVLLWAARRGDDEAVCTGVDAAFGAADTVRMQLAGRTIADNGISCGGGAAPLGPQNAGLDHGQGLGSVHVAYGQVPARVHAVRITFEDGRTRTAAAEDGWVIAAFEQPTRRPGHRPIVEQALDGHGRALATVHLNPWEYGGREPAAPPLDARGSTLLAAVTTTAGRVALRLSAPGRGWQRRECYGVVFAGRSADVECDYPAAFDARIPAAVTTDLFVPGPRVPGVVTAIAANIDRAWLVSANGAVRPARVARFQLAHRPRTVVLAATRGGGGALTGIVTSRHGSIAGALLLASGHDLPPGSATPPCFLTDNGHAPTTAACSALMAAVRRAGVLGG